MKHFSIGDRFAIIGEIYILQTNYFGNFQIRMTTLKKLDLEKIFPELSQYRKSFSNGYRYKDLEGKKWIEFTFLLYLSGVFPDNPYSRISFTSLTPYEWKETKDMLVHLKWYIEYNIGNILFAYLKIVS